MLRWIQSSNAPLPRLQLTYELTWINESLHLDSTGIALHYFGKVILKQYGKFSSTSFEYISNTKAITEV